MVRKRFFILLYSPPLQTGAVVESGAGICTGAAAKGSGCPVSRQIAACNIARDMGTHMALPTAFCAARLPFGKRHASPNPMSTAESRADMVFTVFPSRVAHVSACDAQIVKLCSSTLRRQGSPSRPRVWFFRYCAGTSRPRDTNASRTETRREDGISWRILTSAGGPAMSRILVCGDPKSAASSVANATFSGKRAAYLARTSRVFGVDTFSRDHE